MMPFDDNQIQESQGKVFQTIEEAVGYLIRSINPAHYVAPIHGNICAGYNDNGKQGENRWREHFEVFRYKKNKAIIMVEETNVHDKKIEVLGGKRVEEIYSANTAGE